MTDDRAELEAGLVRVSCPECDWSREDERPEGLEFPTFLHSITCTPLDELKLKVIEAETDLVPIETWNEALQ